MTPDFEHHGAPWAKETNRRELAKTEARDAEYFEGFSSLHAYQVKTRNEDMRSKLIRWLLVLGVICALSIAAVILATRIMMK